MSRVLLVNPPLLLDREYIDYPYYAGLATASNAAALRARGFDVRVADAQARPESGVETAVDGRLLAGCAEEELLCGAGAPRAVVLSLPPFLLPHAGTPFLSALVASLRARFPRARLVAGDLYFGGMHYLEYDGAAFLRRHPELDGLVKYEGEAELPALLASPRGRGPALRLGRAAGVDLDALPLPAWDLVDVPAYQAFLRRFARAAGRPDPSQGLTTLPAVTSRGCAYRCGFCTSNPGERAAAFRPHSLGYLERLFTELRDRHGARRLALLDACPNQDGERFQRVLELLERLGLRCDLPNGLRADRLDRPTLALLKRVAGSVTVSAESGDPEMLARGVGKGLDLAAVERAARWCRGLDLPLSVHWVVGLPGDGVASVNRTLEAALRLKERYGAEPLVQNFVPLPGTRLAGECARRGLLPEPAAASPYAGFRGRPPLSLPGLPAEKLEAMTALFRRRLEAARTRKVIVNLTYRCNNACRFCAVGDRPRRDGDLDRYLRLLAEYRGRGVEALDLDGGEPTLYPGLFPLVRRARALGYRSVTVTTNGRRLSDRGFASRFLLSGITEVLVSLHGPDASVHDALTRRPGSFEQTAAGLRHLVRLRPRRVELGVNTVLTRENAAHADAFFSLVRALGVGKVAVQLVTPFGRAARGPGEDDAALLRAAGPAISRWRRELRIDLVNGLPCRAGQAPELGKHGRDMVFVDSEPRNLAEYLDERRRKDESCLSCAAAIGCAGRYVFPEAA